MLQREPNVAVTLQEGASAFKWNIRDKNSSRHWERISLAEYLACQSIGFQLESHDLNLDLQLHQTSYSSCTLKALMCSYNTIYRSHDVGVPLSHFILATSTRKLKQLPFAAAAVSANWIRHRPSCFRSLLPTWIGSSSSSPGFALSHYLPPKNL